jgi:hypothetical protein
MALPKTTPAAGPAFTLGQDIYNKGKGLLNMPIAGNGYNNIGGGAAGNGFGEIGGKMASNGFGRIGGAVSGNGFGTVGGGVSRNGFGRVEYQGPGQTANPYLQRMAGDVANRTNDMVGGWLNQIQGNSVASGGLGGSRQGVAQGQALGKAADYLSGNLSNMFGQAYEQDSNRALQRYGMDQNFYANQRGQDLQSRGQDQNFYASQRGQDLQSRGLDQDFYNAQRGQDLQASGQAQNFYNTQRGQDLQSRGLNYDFWTAQRGQDLAQMGMAPGMIQSGLNTQWLPMQNAADVYSPFTGFGSTTNSSQQGGGWQGALGGGLGVLGLGSQLGWWGSK